MWFEIEWLLIGRTHLLNLSRNEVKDRAEELNRQLNALNILDLRDPIPAGLRAVGYSSPERIFSA
jgi:hypothetical protein